MKNLQVDNMEKVKFKEGDRVFSYGFGYEQHNGTIHKNTEYPEVSEWYIKYDDGEECAVLDVDAVYPLSVDPLEDSDDPRTMGLNNGLKSPI